MIKGNKEFAKLEICQGHSRSKPVLLSEREVAENFEVKIKELFNDGTGAVLAYLDYGIKIGCFRDGKIQSLEEDFDPMFIQKLRIFNSKAELFIWREDEGGFSGRYRVDGEGEKCSYIDIIQYLWGTQAIQRENHIIMTEERGVQVSLPRKLFNKEIKKKSRAFMKIRNYIGHIKETGQAGYVDCRIMGFDLE